MEEETDIRGDRSEILRLRARVVVLERMALSALELALRIRPEELDRNIEIARLRLSSDYGQSHFASDVTDVAERGFLAREVERLMRGVQADLGFKGGVPRGENG